MSLVNHIAHAFIEAAQKTGVDPIKFLDNMISQSGSFPDAVDTNDKVNGVEKGSKRKYTRVVPEGSLRELSVGTFGTDSLGRIHQVVEHRAFADKTRKAWKLAAVQKPVERSIPACEETVLPEIHVFSDGETAAGESDAKPRRAYNRVVPDIALSDVEEGEIQEDALGRSHVATRVKVRGSGTRLTWKFFQPETEKRASVVSFSEPLESTIHSTLVQEPAVEEPAVEEPTVKTVRARKPYASMKPDSSAKSHEAGDEEEGKDGETWIVKSFSGAKGTRHAWVRKAPSHKVETPQTKTTEINIDAGKGFTAADVAAILRQLNVA